MDYKDIHKQILNLNFKKEYGKMLKLINERYEGEDLPEEAKEAMAFLSIGALISKIFVFWENEQDSMDEVLSYLDTIEEMIMDNQTNNTKKNYNLKDISKSYSYFIDWYKTNSNRFINNNEDSSVNIEVNQLYGIVKDDTIFVFQDIFKKAMKEGGFDPKIIKKKWKNKGFLDCEPGRYTKQKKYKGTNYHMIAVKIMDYNVINV